MDGPSASDVAERRCCPRWRCSACSPIYIRAKAPRRLWRTLKAFAVLLNHTLRGVYQKSFADTVTYKEAITTAAKQYEAIRYPRVQAILENAQRMQNSKQDMGLIAEYIMYCVLWIAGTSIYTAAIGLLTFLGCFANMMSRFQKMVINYDIAENVKAVVGRQA
ncbi:hypothetical protein BDW71DRAFT_169782 [Aspergillus fruticulosus]